MYSPINRICGSPHGTPSVYVLHLVMDIVTRLGHIPALLIPLIRSNKDLVYKVTNLVGSGYGYHILAEPEGEYL